MTPITVLCGFLGSGKTTLLRRWRSEEAMRNAAVIVQDLSELGVDAELVSQDQKVPASGALEGRIAALHGRHAREDLSDSIGRTLQAIDQLTPPPHLILVESTGAARPWPLITALTQSDDHALRHFIVTVDALNLHRDHGDGAALLPGAAPAPDSALSLAADLLREQIQFANVVILTKVDQVDEAVWRLMMDHVRCVNPWCAIALSAHAGLHYEQLEDTPPPILETMRTRAATLGLSAEDRHSTAETIESLIFRDRRPFHPERLFEVCQHNLGTGLYRTKGFLWLASRPGDVLLWQQSGSQIALEFMGWWRAELALNRDGKLLPEEVEHLCHRLRTADPVFGDRHNELTLIGLPAARDVFARALQDCLCTEEEVRAWKNGVSFNDPWPATMRQQS